MSAEIKALAAGYPTDFPSEGIDFLIGVLTKKEPFDRLKAAKYAYDTVGFLMGKFFSIASADSVAKGKKASKKAIADALAALKGGGDFASVKAMPAWLIPILLDLAKKWLESKV